MSMSKVYTFANFLENKTLEKKLGLDKFDPKQIRMGIEVEKEHDGKMGKDVDVVKSKSDLLKIVTAHLREDPKYYTKLKKIEKTN